MGGEKPFIHILQSQIGVRTFKHKTKVGGNAICNGGDDVSRRFGPRGVRNAERRTHSKRSDRENNFLDPPEVMGREGGV